MGNNNILKVMSILLIVVLLGFATNTKGDTDESGDKEQVGTSTDSGSGMSADVSGEEPENENTTAVDSGENEKKEYEEEDKRQLMDDDVNTNSSETKMTENEQDGINATVSGGENKRNSTDESSGDGETDGGVNQEDVWSDGNTNITVVTSEDSEDEPKENEKSEMRMQGSNNPQSCRINPQGKTIPNRRCKGSTPTPTTTPILTDDRLTSTSTSTSRHDISTPTLPLTSRSTGKGPTQTDDRSKSSLLPTPTPTRTATPTPIPTSRSIGEGSLPTDDGSTLTDDGSTAILEGSTPTDVGSTLTPTQIDDGSTATDEGATAKTTSTYDGTTPTPTSIQTDDGSTPADEGSTSTDEGSTPIPTQAYDGSTSTDDGSTPIQTQTDDASTPTDEGSTSADDGSTAILERSTPTDDGSTLTPTQTDEGSTATDEGATAKTTSTYDGTTPTPTSTQTDDGSTPTDEGSTSTDEGSTPIPTQTYDGSTPTDDGSTPIQIQTDDASTPTDDGSTSADDGSTAVLEGSTPTDDGSTLTPTQTDDGSTATDEGSTPIPTQAYDGSTPTDDGSTPIQTQTDDASTPTDDGSTSTDESSTLIPTQAYDGSTPTDAGSTPIQTQTDDVSTPTDVGIIPKTAPTPTRTSTPASTPIPTSIPYDDDGAEPTDKSSNQKNKEKKRQEAIEYLKEKAKDIVANNKTQVQNVMKSFTEILSGDDEATESAKLENDIIAVQLLEKVGAVMASQLMPNQSNPASVGQINNEQVFGVVRMQGANKSDFAFPDMIQGLENVSSFPARVQLPSAVLNNDAGGNLSCVFMIYTASSKMRMETGDKNINVTGKVLLVSLFPKPTNSFKKPVMITIKNTFLLKNYSNGTFQPICVFLMENASIRNSRQQFGAWSNQGCIVSYSNASHTICHCDHLTNFAILTRFSPGKIQPEHELALSIITYIGLSLSIFGCLATLVVHLVLPKLWTDRGFIHMNLVVALGIANLVFLFQKLPDIGSDGCTALALVLLYFYLTAFAWMMLEGIHIYRMLVKVFETGKDPRKTYFMIGWGLPVILVIITITVFQDEVTSEYYCWLSATSGAMWMFAGPVCLVIFVNTFMLLVVLKTSFHHSKHEKNLRRSMAKTFCVLLPVLGLTWLIGLITFNKDIIAMQYIFAILNSLQGFFIFLFYVVYSHEVRKEIAHRVEIWKTEKEISENQHVSRESKLRYSEQTSSVQPTPLKAW